ncbi:MAG: MFS quinate transporter [Lasallia pustulata]|uniref:MFS quinate transporter n=1 Tax=Lasallia pustulata TaxID=136370 RepID=A0A5M8PR80_9LECA|nr:MAG: MFS quinate transporter [Lasallia pustulata]
MFPFLRTWGEEWNRAIDDIGTYRRAYILTLVASYGGILFGWDTGLIGGILTTSAFQKSFALNPKSKDFKNLQGNIVSVLQGGCFFGAASSYYISDTLGRKRASLLQVGSFFSALYCRPVRA